MSNPLIGLASRLQDHLTLRKLEPQRHTSQEMEVDFSSDKSAGAVWTLQIAHSLEGELALLSSPLGGTYLTYTVSTEVSEIKCLLEDLNIFAAEAADLIAPVQLLRSGHELSVVATGLAGDGETLCLLFDEMHLMLRKSLGVAYLPWVQLARGETDLDAATLRFAAALVQFQELEGNTV
jgi:hypothetical protein